VQYRKSDAADICLLLFVLLNVDTDGGCLFVMTASIATRRKGRFGIVTLLTLYNMH